MEAGITQPSLQFILGVNADTLSAYLLRSNAAGALKIALDADYAEDLTKAIEIWPYRQLAAFEFPPEKTIRLKTVSHFLLQTSRGADTLDPILGVVRIQSQFPLGALAMTTDHPAPQNSTSLIPIALPAGTSIISFSSEWNAGYVIIGANLIPIPPFS